MKKNTPNHFFWHGPPSIFFYRQKKMTPPKKNVGPPQKKHVGPEKREKKFNRFLTSGLYFCNCLCLVRHNLVVVVVTGVWKKGYKFLYCLGFTQRWFYFKEKLHRRQTQKLYFKAEIWCNTIFLEKIKFCKSCYFKWTHMWQKKTIFRPKYKYIHI